MKWITAATGTWRASFGYYASDSAGEGWWEVYDPTAARVEGLLCVDVAGGLQNKDVERDSKELELVQRALQDQGKRSEKLRDGE